MPRSFLYIGILASLAATRLFGASSITYAKNGTADSINLDLSIIESSRREDGALVLHASSSIAKRSVRLKLVICDRWRDWEGLSKGPRIAKHVDTEILADGAESEFLDKLVWRSFPPETETPKSLFCPTYVGLTVSTRDDLERRRIMFWISDCALCGDHEIQVVLDFQQKSLKMAIFEGSYGRRYPDRINEVFEKRANQTSEP